MAVMFSFCNRHDHAWRRMFTSSISLPEGVRASRGVLADFGYDLLNCELLFNVRRRANRVR